MTKTPDRRQILKYGAGAGCAFVLSTYPTRSDALVVINVSRIVGFIVSAWQGKWVSRRTFGNRRWNQLEDPLKEQGFTDGQRHYSYEKNILVRSDYFNDQDGLLHRIGDPGHRKILSVVGKKPRKPAANCLVTETSTGPAMHEGGALVAMHKAHTDMVNDHGIPARQLAKLTLPIEHVQNTPPGDIYQGYGGVPLLYKAKQSRVALDWVLHGDRPNVGRGEYVIKNTKNGDVYKGKTPWFQFA